MLSERATAIGTGIGRRVAAGGGVWSARWRRKLQIEKFGCRYAVGIMLKAESVRVLTARARGEKGGNALQSYSS